MKTRMGLSALVGFVIIGTVSANADSGATGGVDGTPRGTTRGTTRGASSGASGGASTAAGRTPHAGNTLRRTDPATRPDRR
ncbi:hypothetical protein [Streptomyces sp. NPDC021562]|uniref:hypothetical protein n=1 Tax=Streptomyces sp. NPDC021562 TaxID=3155121 RepID=UPI0033EFA29A